MLISKSIETSVPIHINQFIDELRTNTSLPNKLQIIGTSDVITQIISLAATTRWSKIILIPSTPRDVSPLLSLLEQNSKMLMAADIAASHLPHLSMWGSDRFINPSLSRHQRLDSLFRMGHKTRKIEGAFKSLKMNYVSLGNVVEHLHWHVMPRYGSDPDHKDHPWKNSSKFSENPTTLSAINSLKRLFEGDNFD